MAKLIRDALQAAIKRLANVSDVSYLDAQWLLLEVLGRNEVSYLLAHSEEELNADQTNRFEMLVKRRTTGEPLAYILGYWEFYGRRFIVNEDVLVPRPSTENLVNKALDALLVLARQNGGRTLNVADIGTGSGCLIITLALELANSEISNFKFQMIATDISPTALAVARENARQHGVFGKIKFLEGNMLEPLQDEQIDLLVSNPPYLQSREVSGFEPNLALDGGLGGQHFVRQLLGQNTPAVIETTGGLVRTHKIDGKK